MVLIVLGSNLILAITVTATAVTIKGSSNPTEMATNISMCVIFLYIQQQTCSFYVIKICTGLLNKNVDTTISNYHHIIL